MSRLNPLETPFDPIKAPELTIGNNGRRVIVQLAGKPFWSFSPAESAQFASLMIKHASLIVGKDVAPPPDGPAPHHD